MVSYAVTLQPDGEAPSAGRLDIDRKVLRFRGRNPAGQLRIELPADEIVSAGKNAGVGDGPGRTIRIETRTLGAFLVASIGGVGILSEILDAINGLV